MLKRLAATLICVGFALGITAYASAETQIYPAPEVELNAPERDGSYVLDIKLQDEIATEINAYREQEGLSALAVNHSLVYRPQVSTNPLRNTVFDNLRWCRETLEGRTLRHTSTMDSGEILVQGARKGKTAAHFAEAWYSSPGHRRVMVREDAVELGVLVIEYPNGDIDIAALFLYDYSIDVTDSSEGNMIRETI